MSPANESTSFYLPKTLTFFIIIYFILIWFEIALLKKKSFYNLIYTK